MKQSMQYNAIPTLLIALHEILFYREESISNENAQSANLQLYAMNIHERANIIWLLYVVIPRIWTLREKWINIFFIYK